MFARYPSLLKRWVGRADLLHFDAPPWTGLTKPVADARLALVTTGGVHLKSQIPFNMLDAAGDPTFRQIPADVKPEALTITHQYYDHRDAGKDVNIVLPVQRVRLLEKAGEIGSVNARHYSFMGHITPPHVATLIKDTAVQVAENLKRDGVDAVILTPA